MMMDKSKKETFCQNKSEKNECPYDFYVSSETTWPCLSFDLFAFENQQEYETQVKACDNEFTEGNIERKSQKKKKSNLKSKWNSKHHIPNEIFCVGGSQAVNAEDNQIYVMKWGDLKNAKNIADIDSSSSDDSSCSSFDDASFCDDDVISINSSDASATSVTSLNNTVAKNNKHKNKDSVVKHSNKNKADKRNEKNIDHHQNIENSESEQESEESDENEENDESDNSDDNSEKKKKKIKEKKDNVIDTTEDEVENSSIEKFQKKTKNIKSGGHMGCQAIKHGYGCINKIKINKKKNSLVSAWCDDSNIYIYDISKELENIYDGTNITEVTAEPVHIFQNHKTEGFSMDWNPIHSGVLLSGDNNGIIYLWKPNEAGKWNYESFDFKNEANCNFVDDNNDNNNNNNNNNNNKKKKKKKQKQKKKKNNCSIEDIEWIPNGNGVGAVFGMCSSDGTIRVKDIRIFKKGGSRAGNENGNGTGIGTISTSNSTYINGKNVTNNDDYSEISIINGHKGEDVNCISWNKKSEFLLASGGDDKIVNIWDIRMFQEPVACLSHHKDGISSISWHPLDSSVLLVSCFDGNISFWDLSVESETIDKQNEKLNVPDQLLFEHITGCCVSEAKFHPQYPGYVVATSSENINIFKPFNM